MSNVGSSRREGADPADLSHIVAYIENFLRVPDTDDEDNEDMEDEDLDGDLDEDAYEDTDESAVGLESIDLEEIPDLEEISDPEDIPDLVDIPDPEESPGVSRSSIPSIRSAEAAVSELRKSRALQRQKPFSNAVDFRSLEYVGSYDHNLMCAICHCPFVEPARLDCDHVFCRDCINQALMHQTRDAKCCPACRTKTRRISTIPVPKIINRILDDLVVRCPFSKEGCAEELPRGAVQDHVDRYCIYSEVECPSDECPYPVQRKDAEKQRCLHSRVRCEYCEVSLIEREMESHQTHCSVRTVPCPHCKTTVLYGKLESHIESCPEASLPCTAALYGCDFTSDRASLDQHTTTCPLAKLIPFLKFQNDRLAAHETALNHLRLKNSLLETSFSTIQETLNAPSNLLETNPSLTSSPEDNSPFDSTAHHLLCMHESLREEIGRVSAAVSELDAKASMMVMNESLRTKEELAHTNAAVGGMRMHLHWLMSARLQNQQRGMMRAGEPELVVGASRAGGLAGELGPSVRRLSDSTRQDTKL